MNKKILRLAIPNIISNISIPLLSSVDTFLMGHLSSLELGAVGIAGMIFNFLYWNFGFLRMGTTGMTAQAYGRKDNPEISALLQRSLIVALGISLLMMLLMVPIAKLSLYLMNIQSEQAPFVLEYFYTRIWAAPATLGLYALLGWYFGMQDARTPLLITIAINVVNIILSYILVMQFGYGIQGVALGTVIAQYFGFLVSLIIIRWKYSSFLTRLGMKTLMAWENIQKFVVINRDIFLRTVCLSFAFAFLYSQASLNGSLYLAANVVLLQFLNWMSYAIDGFAYAAESLVGKYHGASDRKMTYRSINYLFLWGAGLALLFTLLYALFGDQMIALFTDQEEVRTYASNLLIWVILMPVIAFACYIWDGIYIGLTASVSMRNTMVIALVIYLLTFYLGKYYFEYNNIWLALLIFLAARGILQGIVFWRKGLDMA